MNEGLDEFQERILVENNCLVQVQWSQIEDNRFLSVNFASLMTVIYFTAIKEGFATIFISNQSIENHKEYVCVPIYIYRLYIFLDILRRCRGLNLPGSLLRFINEQGEKTTYLDLVQINYINEDDTKKEVVLDAMVSKYLESANAEPDERLKVLNGDNESLEKFGLLYSFSILKGLLL
jgi:hypothetical protein